MIRTESLGFSGSIWEQEGIGSIIQRTDIHQGPFKAKFRGTFRKRSRKVHEKFKERESPGSNKGTFKWVQGQGYVRRLYNMGQSLMYTTARVLHTCCCHYLRTLLLLLASVLVKFAPLTLRHHTLQAPNQTQHLCLARRLSYPLHGNYTYIYIG